MLLFIICVLIMSWVLSMFWRLALSWIARQFASFKLSSRLVESTSSPTATPAGIRKLGRRTVQPLTEIVGSWIYESPSPPETAAPLTYCRIVGNDGGLLVVAFQPGTALTRFA